MAVSPDGTQLALTVNSGRPAVQRIVVVDLLTASRTSWRGGLSRSGMLFGIPAPSWTADGRSLVFTGSWCTVARGPMWYEQGVRRDDEMFSLNPSDGGGSLSSARPLLTQSARYPLIVAAYAGPSGTDIVAVVLSGSVRASGSAVVWSDLAVLDISPASGAVVDVLYRHAGTNHYPVWLAPDPSDRYFLLEADGLSAPDPAWIGGGTLHLLPFRDWPLSW